MNSKSFLLITILITVVFGTFTICILDQPFGFLFNIALYTFIIGLLITLFKTSFFLLKNKNHFSKLCGILLGIIALVLVIGTLIISYDYRVLYFKSPIPKPTKSEWQEDLSYLSNELRSIHPDIYSMISKEKLDSLENEVYNRIPNSNESDILMDLFRFTSLPNDAHTFPFIFFPCFDLHNLPIQLYGFNDGWYIVDAARRYKNLIGTKVIKIGSKNINEVFENFPVLLGTENNQSRRERFTYMVVIPEWLKYNGLIEDTDNVNITCVDQSNNIITKNLPSYKYYPLFIWSNVFKIENKEPHVFTNPRKDWYQFTPIEGGKILYIEYHQCDNQMGKETVEEFANSLERHINENFYERYIVDLRSNDGGNSNLNDRLIEVITNSEKMNKYGKLYVLIGRRTFSAAVMFANQLQMLSNPIFVGEGTSQGPNFFGGPNLIELPNSRLVFGISSRQTVGGLSFDDRNMIEPDIKINYSIDDFLSNSDPTLNAAINHIPNELSNQYTEDNPGGIVGDYSINNTDYVEIYKTDGSLCINITDYVPNSLARFNSPLYADSSYNYLTKIDHCYIESHLNQKNQVLYLNYLGKKFPINQVVGTKQLAMKMLSDGDIESGIKAIKSDPDHYIDTYKNLEQLLNSLGYQLMEENKPKQAILVFEANVILYPSSSNVYDSLAESFMNIGKYELAINNYNKSLELNPNNLNAVNMIEEIKKYDK